MKKLKDLIYRRLQYFNEKWVGVPLLKNINEYADIWEKGRWLLPKIYWKSRTHRGNFKACQNKCKKTINIDYCQKFSNIAKIKWKN